MHLRLKTKITLTIAFLVLAVVGVNSALSVATLTRQVIHQADNRASLVVQRVFFQTQTALADAAREGKAPASNQPADVREYARAALGENASLTSLIDAEVADPLLYEVTIVDRDATALTSSDTSLPGRKAPSRPPLSQFVNASFFRQLRIIYGPQQAYAVTYPFQLGPAGHQVPLGEIRVAVDTSLLRNEITPALYSAGGQALASVLISLCLAFIVSNVSLAPLGRISAQLDRISRGEFDQQPLESGDEFGQVSTKIIQIGQQLRGVREIFSTLRENVDQVLGGLEDGLLLFSQDGRAVMVSPAVENFLGAPSDQLLGRAAGEIFPPLHPLRSALGLAGEQFEPVAAAEVDVQNPEAGLPPRRIGVSVQIITEGGTRMALVRFHNLESRDLTSLLQVSEHMSALSRCTAGVAHEVKNPLNSMRLWLENLKETLPPGEELPLQAVAVLDNEIDRLDSVVKRFLDFMRPPQGLRFEETHLSELLNEVAGVARAQMVRSGVQLDTRFAEVPPVRVDRQLLKQALLNLVFNAIEAMPAGGELTLALDRRGEMAEIRVSDTGQGIPPEKRGRVFQLFFTTRPGGSGIGLASAYKAVQLHEGEIEFESEVGRGTTFRIELPLSRGLEPAFSRLRHERENSAPREVSE